MSKELPMKSKILMMFEEKDYWDFEAVENLLLLESKQDSDYWRYNARFWLAELAINGLLEIIEEDVDADGVHFEPNMVMTKYRLTEFGKQSIDSMLR